ncbi:MAG: hypothetical protein Alpg2KO_30780 [Alphaproteobacteria bacterium]
MLAEGSSHVREYGGEGPSVLLVPSLVNSSDILDLMPDHSFARFLVGQGFRVRMLEWGQPGELESRFSLSDLVAGRLNRLIGAVAAHDGQPPLVIGYCMGGVLALGAALTLPPGAVSGLVLLATPWDFHAGEGEKAEAQRIAALLGPICAALPDGACLPGDVIQSLFWMLDPMTSLHKFRRFAAMPMEDEAATRFVLLEDWLNEPRGLPGPIARACMTGWYGRNDLANGQWMLGGLRINPERLSCPALCVIPQQDRIVPAVSARALADQLPQADVMAPELGHIGLIASRSAPDRLWHDLSSWMKGV